MSNPLQLACWMKMIDGINGHEGHEIMEVVRDIDTRDFLSLYVELNQQGGKNGHRRSHKQQALEKAIAIAKHAKRQAKVYNANFDELDPINNVNVNPINNNNSKNNATPYENTAQVANVIPLKQSMIIEKGNDKKRVVNDSIYGLYKNYIAENGKKKRLYIVMDEEKEMLMNVGIFLAKSDIRLIIYNVVELSYQMYPPTGDYKKCIMLYRELDLMDDSAYYSTVHYAGTGVTLLDVKDINENTKYVLDSTDFSGTSGVIIKNGEPIINTIMREINKKE